MAYSEDQREPAPAAQLRRDLSRARAGARSRRLKQLRGAVLRALKSPPELSARVYLFGSWATGAFDGQSDIDLLVIAPDVRTAEAAQVRLYSVADDVVATSQECWQSRLRGGSGFWQRLARERQLLADTWGIAG